MHAIYTFLIDTPEESESGPVIEKAASNVEGYIAASGDENNWWELLIMILPDGSVLEDRGKKEDFSEITAAPDAFEAVKRFAM